MTNEVGVDDAQGKEGGGGVEGGGECGADGGSEGREDDQVADATAEGTGLTGRAAASDARKVVGGSGAAAHTSVQPDMTAAQRAAAEKAAADAFDWVGWLEKMFDLKEKGVLTQEEFDKEKRRIMARKETERKSHGL